jgi:hypothetical protein
MLAIINKIKDKFVVVDILETAGLKLDRLYTTDLAKCQSLNNQTPKTVSERHAIIVKDFKYPFFYNCRPVKIRTVLQIL